MNLGAPGGLKREFQNETRRSVAFVIAIRSLMRNLIQKQVIIF